MTYEPVIGLEIHVQLSTASKVFCADSTSFGAEANTHTSIISLAHPGALPRINTKVVDSAITLGLALNGNINKINTFDRKSYFYPDLPKGYQITQDRKPVCVGGEIPIRLSDGTEKMIGLHHFHIEEDAGKSIHDQNAHFTLIDLNRAGTPLLEIVTLPDIHSAEEVDALMTAMRQLVRWLGVSDGNMEEGSMRCDVNISIRPQGSSELNTRCEIKNMNSMRYARRAIAYEVQRQIDVVTSGEQVVQSTLNFDPETGITTPMRSKENAHDYRYFPDPDLPPVLISEKKLNDSKVALPILPWEAYQLLQKKYALTPYDAAQLSNEKSVFDFYTQFVETFHETSPQLFKPAANLIINKIIPFADAEKINISAFPITNEKLIGLLKLVENKSVAPAVAFSTMFDALLLPENFNLSTETLAQKLELIQTNDALALETWVTEVMAKNPDKVLAYQKGKKGLIGFFMGEVMKLARGKAEPKATEKLLLEKLGQS